MVCMEESHHLFIIIKIGLWTTVERWLLGAMHLAINPGLVWLLSPVGHLGSYSGPHAWLSTHGMWWLSLESYPRAFLIKFFKWLKMFWFGNYRINLLYANYAKRSTSQISCSIVFLQQPPNLCQLPVCHCTDPFHWGCIFKCAGYSEEE
jgi:hypothetical protein